MKKIMGLVLGLSLAIGAFTVALAQGDSPTKQTGKGTGKAKGKKGSGKDTTKK